MKTIIQELFFIIVLFVYTSSLYSQENNNDQNTPYYMTNPSNKKVIKSIKRNMPNYIYAPLGYDCHTYNGDTIIFINGVTSTIGSQVSPDIPIPQIDQKDFETTCDPSIIIDPLNNYNVFTAGTAFVLLNGIDLSSQIDQESGLYQALPKSWHWTGGTIFHNKDSTFASFNPAVGILKSGDRKTYYVGNQMVYYYNGGKGFGQGQGISYSTDNGTSWTNKMIELAYLGNDPDDSNYFLVNNHLSIDAILVSPYYGHVYSAWTPSTNWDEGYDYAQLFDWGKIEFKYSLDGINWGLYDKPLVISNITENGVPPVDSVLSYGVNIQTGNNGEVYAVWAMYKNNPAYGSLHPIKESPLYQQAAPPYGNEIALGFTKSTDGGQTFDRAHVIANNINGVHEDVLANFAPFINSHGYNAFSFPVMCVDHSVIHPGRIYVAWSNLGVPGINTGQSADIYVIHSDTYGQSWSSPIRINTPFVPNGGDYKFSINPWITCDNETGKVCVIFYDDRNYRDSRFDVYVCMSKDGGTTWEESTSDINIESEEYGGISDSTFCTGGVVTNMAQIFFSDYNGITVKDGLAYPVWTTDMMAYSTNSSHTYTTMSPYYIWNCIPDTVLINYDLVYHDVQKFECQNYISTYDSVTISTGAFSFFDAGDSITLHPGFHAENDSYFHAYIDGCVPFDGVSKYYRYCSGNGFPDNGNNVYKSYIYDKLIKVYPNPTEGNLTISIGEFDGEGKLVLLNAMNESLLELNPSSQTTYNLDLSAYPKGIYFVKLFTKDRTYVNKIIYE